VAIAPEWVSAAGKTPAGLDLYGLGSALETLTHGKTRNPFPPPVTPPPGPTPAVEPPTLQRERDLYAALGAWAKVKRTGQPAVIAAALQALFKRAGLL
jgi:hypothetical protein